MASEFNILLPSSAWTVYGVLIKDTDDTAYNTSSVSFEALDTGARTKYNITATGSGAEKKASMPSSIASGWYIFKWFKQQGGSPAATDLPIGDTGRWYWNLATTTFINNTGTTSSDPWTTDISGYANPSAGYDLFQLYSRTIQEPTIGSFSFGRAFTVDFLNLLLTNANIPNFGDATGLRGSTVAGNLYVSLHTADPGDTGDQTTNEATYTSYTRVAIARSTSGVWSVTGTVSPAQAYNLNAITFPAATGGSNTITYAAIGTQPTGAGEVVLRCVLSASIAVITGITPRILSGALVIQGP